MNEKIVKDEVLLDVKGLSQLIWKLSFTEAIPEVVKLMTEEVDPKEFEKAVIERVTLLSEAVYKVVTEDELSVLFPEIITGINLGFLADKVSFNMYIKKAKQADFKKIVFENFVVSMFLLSIKAILEAQGPENDEVGESVDKRENLILLEGGKPAEPTVSE